MSTLRTEKIVFFIVLALLFVGSVLSFNTTYAQVNFRTPLNTGTAINNLFDNDLTVGTKKIYNCTVSPATGVNDNHRGVDFPVAAGTAVVSAAAGRIYDLAYTCSDTGSLADNCGSGYGNHYRVDHAGNTTDGSGLVSIYAHMRANSITLADNTPVACGQFLGYSAASGKVTGAHLHFELRTEGTSVNTKIDPFVGNCSHLTPPNWMTLSNGQPTTQCDPRPLAPSNVGISSPTGSSLNVNFTDNALNETAILVERKVGAGSWSQITTFNTLNGASGWYWTNTGLLSGTTYCYRLRSQNGSSFSAGPSNEACGTTLVVATPPAAPSNVFISNATINSLQVNFTDNANNETNVLLERKIGTGGSWSQITSFGTLSGTGTWNWVNSGLSSGTTYCYHLRTQNGSGYSPYSNESCGTTVSGGGALPLAPSNVSVTSPTTNSLRVNFKDNATNETAILIERKIGTSGAWTSFGSFSALSGTSNWYWINSGLSSRTTYCYRFRATNSAGSSSYSNAACGTTL